MHKPWSGKPHILLLLTDQQRFDSLGCFGGIHVDTPVLDHLAAGGAVFENCYVNATICTPSRASMLTGKPMQGHGVYKLHDNMPLDEIMFPKRLQEAGYKTALIGKQHVSGYLTEARQRHPNDGYDIYEACIDPKLSLDSEFNAHADWIRRHHPEFWERLIRDKKSVTHFPAEIHNAFWAAERTINFIENHSSDQPFFCKMSLFDPHAPYNDYPPEALELVNRDNLKQPRDHTKRFADVPEGVRREQKKFSRKYAAAHDVLADDMAGYYASIGFLDQQMGRVLQKLEEKGIANRTLIIFLSDHGDMMGDKQLISKGAYFYDACSKVPFIIRYPGHIPAGVRRRQLIQPHDIAATILNAAGCEEDDIQRWMPDSMNLLPLAAEDASGRNHAVTMYRNTGYGDRGGYWDPPLNCSMYRSERYKLNIYHDSADESGNQQGELFDMLQDPGETENLWNNPAYTDLKLNLLFRFSDWMVQQENTYQSGRGGEALTWKA